MDAANGAIALGAEALEREPYFAGPGYVIDPSRCETCGLCASACRFNAIELDAVDGRYRIVPELCERCGACLDLCTRNAVQTEEKMAGELFVSRTRSGMTMVHADLEPGEDTSGKLVGRVRERAESLAIDGTVAVVDCPPGIGCPVIASLTRTDLVLVVIEASASGARDAERLMKLAASMRRRMVAVLNKTGLDPEADDRARGLAARAGVPVAGEIPFDPVLRSMEEGGHTWLDAGLEAGGRVQRALEAVRGVVAALERNRTNEKTIRKEYD